MQNLSFVIIPLKDHFTLRSESLFKASLSSPKKQQSRRGVISSDPLFFREMAHESNTRRSFLRDVLGTFPYFSERMSQAECLCEAEKRMKVSSSQITKLKSFHGLTKEVANTRVCGATDPSVNDF